MSESDQPSATPTRVALWSRLLNFLANIGNLTALLISAGFFVVHSHMATFTNIFTYNVSIVQYISAGVNVFVGTLYVVFISTFTRNFGRSFIWLIVILVVVVIFSVALWRSKGETKKRIETIWRGYTLLSLSATILLSSLVGFGYGSVYYEDVPRMFGGGAPAQVILVFNEVQSQDTTWPFGINAQSPRHSRPVWLMMEVSDGILVRQDDQNPTVFVSNDLLSGMIDVNHPTSLNYFNTLAQPIATATSTPVVTPTP